MIDLHSHSVFSDGDLEPSELIHQAKKGGLEIRALTDHETLDGIPLFLETGKKLGVKTIPGVEISADFEGVEEHILGLSINYKSPALKEFLKKRRLEKLEQIKAIIKKTRKFGFLITESDVLKSARGLVCRIHIARAVLREKRNRPVLKKYGVKTREDFFRLFLKEKGLAFVDGTRPSVKETIQAIKQCGGISAWAHPFEKNTEMRIVKQKAQKFKDLGLDGIEVCCPNSSREKGLFLHEISRELSLFETIGSDFHGFRRSKKRVRISTFGIKLNLPAIYLKNKLP